MIYHQFRIKIDITSKLCVFLIELSVIQKIADTNAFA